jgi:CheY-like chemotaxis protein
MKKIKILLVEDNEGDILLTIEALQEGRLQNSVNVIKDGKSAIDFLNKRGDFVNMDLPDLILLDINLPRKDGHEVLHYIKNSETFKQIPVVMLTTSSSESDINYSYKNFANCYITKPVEADDFMNAVTKIEDFWTNIAELPHLK